MGPQITVTSLHLIRNTAKNGPYLTQLREKSMWAPFFDSQYTLWSKNVTLLFVE